MRDNLLIILFCFAYKDCINKPRVSKSQAKTSRHWKFWVKSIRLCQRAPSRPCADSHRSHVGDCAEWGAASIWTWALHLSGLRQQVGRSFLALQGSCCFWLLGKAGAGALALLPGWTRAQWAHEGSASSPPVSGCWLADVNSSLAGGWPWYSKPTHIHTQWIFLFPHINC